ncbi:MAG: Lpg1974 family pore-forming outer membrane protein [Simkaniaceae bacterium]|nr:Lpg1974 family pore-forming outer membrane protein [Simkaniaceae bacterium]
MELNLRKILSLAGFLCLTTTAVSAAQDMQSHHDMDKPRQITPAASPRVENGADVFITADFIYWSVREDGLNFATSGYAAAPTTTLAKGKVYQPDFNWHPGFKAGLGLTLAHDDWDLFLEYTWMNAPMDWTTATNNGTDNSTLQSSWIFDVNDSVQRLTRATGAWSNNVNTADLTMGRHLFISHYLALHPHIGLKASWQKQRYKAYYQETDGVLGDITETRLSFRQQFFGIGLLAGIDSSYYFDKNWSLFGDFAASALASHFDVDHKSSQFLILNGEKNGANTVPLYFDEKVDTITPVLEWAMGVRWDYWFNEDSYHVALQLGWEQQFWLDMNRFHNVFDGGARGNLTMQGVTFKFRFDF